MSLQQAITEFRGKFRGAVIEPQDAAYDEARQVYNRMIDRKPRLIAKCADVADVITAVRMAKANGLRVSIRGGGHNAAGLGVCDDGLVIDLAPVKYVEWILRRALYLWAQAACGPMWIMPRTLSDWQCPPASSPARGLRG